MPAEECMYCGLPLSGDHDGWGHARCAEAFEAYCAAAEVEDNRDPARAERDLRKAGKCQYQIRPRGWDGPATYCGQPAAGDWCPVHEREVQGDDTGAADLRASLVQRLLSDDNPPTANSGGTVTTTTESNAGETYTHRAWLDWAGNCMDQLGTLQDSLDAMCAQIAADDGDQAQADAIREWQAAIEGVQAEGHRMVDQVNAVQLPVGEAVAAAGGPANTAHAEYADEARSA